jgi:hypothetical protein
MEKAAVYSFESGERLEVNKTKKRRIRWDRIALVVGLGALLVYGAISLVSDLVHHVPNWVEARNEESLNNDIANYEQVRIVVGKGETAWGIQRELTPNERDIRHPLYLAKLLNPGVNLGDMQAGEIVILLKEKSGEPLTANVSN